MLWIPPMAAYVKQVSWKSAKCFKGEMVRRRHTDTQHGDINSLLCYSFSRQVHHKSDLLLYVSRCFKSKHCITSNGTGSHECIWEEEVVGYSNVARPINLSIFHSRTHSINQSLNQSNNPSVQLCVMTLHVTVITLRVTAKHIKYTHARELTHTVSYTLLLSTSSGLLLLLLTLLHTLFSQ
jgi:hypothetical protein